MKTLIGILIFVAALVGAIVGIVLVAGAEFDHWFYRWLVIGIIVFVWASLIIVSGVLFEQASRDRDRAEARAEY
ncbi:MAG: hypothetical protein FWE16_03770 [Firmicutes bacterium]|nr:hypothetical protein [Bacillota bacterium]